MSEIRSGFMNGSREVILAFLSELKIRPGTQIPREDIVLWCLREQERFGVDCKERTYSLQINKMIFGSEKNNKEGHSEGLDNVFCPSSLGQTFVVTIKAIC
jgi:hypothetical protein